jgi:2',3'-cyclic-nucleotide 2'-phosphodiesterase (5'-nucleotidase family)
MIKRYFTLLLACFILILPSCNSHVGSNAVLISYRIQEINDSIKTNKEVERLIIPYRDSLNEEMNKVIGVSRQLMTKGFPEGLLGNFVTDLMLEYGRENLDNNIDFAIVNNGGLRSALPKDTLLLHHVYELMPFDNKVVILTMKNSQMEQLFDYIIQNKNISVSGMRLHYSEDKLLEVSIDSNQYDSTKKYELIISDYLANGGDDMFFLKDADKKEFNLLLRDMILNYTMDRFNNGKYIGAKKDGRIQLD